MPLFLNFCYFSLCLWVPLEKRMPSPKNWALTEQQKRNDLRWGQLSGWSLMKGVWKKNWLYCLGSIEYCIIVLCVFWLVVAHWKSRHCNSCIIINLFNNVCNAKPTGKRCTFFHVQHHNIFLLVVFLCAIYWESHILCYFVHWNIVFYFRKNRWYLYVNSPMLKISSSFTWETAKCCLNPTACDNKSCNGVSKNLNYVNHMQECN